MTGLCGPFSHHGGKMLLEGLYCYWCFVFKLGEKCTVLM